MNKQLTEDLHFLLSEYLELFMKLRPRDQYRGSISLIEDYEKINTWVDADNFFGMYGVGNSVIERDQPLERSWAYELLLYILQQYDKERYSNIHKGTPYYFIGWTLYEFGNFEKAFFYLDAAVSEDLKIYEERGKQETPAMAFFLLRETPTSSVGLFTLHTPHNYYIADAFSPYCNELNLDRVLYKYGFIEKFVTNIIFEKDRLKNKKMRSVLTAVYGFISESRVLNKLILLRSSEGGSLEPFVNHLFSGARILESLLKLKGKGSNLEDTIENMKIRLDLRDIDLRGNYKSLESAVEKHTDLKGKNQSFQRCNFEAAYIIRNTTGHSLLWEDFLTEKNYSVLYSCLINSILWSIDKLWIQEEI